MKISEHCISQENGTEYYKITFNIYNKIDISQSDYNYLENLIEEELYKIEENNKYTFSLSEKNRLEEEIKKLTEFNTMLLNDLNILSKKNPTK
jgi:hypothetical protein